MQPVVRSIALALQGTGSHGAFAWGVLDRLLQVPELRIVGIGGSGAGAINGVIVADGLRRAGATLARAQLARYWQNIGTLTSLAELAPRLPRDLARPWHPDHDPCFLAHDTLRGIGSPRRDRASHRSALRGLLESIDFDALRSDTAAARVCVCATHVRTGAHRVFHNAGLSLEVLLASACLPQLHQAVAIDGEHHWDGGCSANAALAPLLERSEATDVMVVGVNPFSSIEDALAPNAAVERTGGPLHFHAIGDELLISFGASSQTNSEPRFLRHLHALGVRCTERWLDRHRAAVGHRSTVDRPAQTASKGAAMPRAARAHARWTDATLALGAAVVD